MWYIESIINLTWFILKILVFELAEMFDMMAEILSGLVGYKVWHLITGCHLCVGLT